MFNARTQEFEFHPGPVFTPVLLADEINRATPKTQAALLQAMSERAVSSDGVTRPLPEPFLVLATQNPVEYLGTYPLPESQLDRFLMRISLGYPAPEEERRLLLSGGADRDARRARAGAHARGAVGRAGRDRARDRGRQAHGLRARDRRAHADAARTCSSASPARLAGIFPRGAGARARLGHGPTPRPTTSSASRSRRSPTGSSRPSRAPGTAGGADGASATRSSASSTRRFQAFAGKLHGASDETANIDFVILNDEQQNNAADGRPSEALFSVESSHNQAINFDFPPSMNQPVKYYLVFRNPDGNKGSKFVEANFRVDF